MSQLVKVEEEVRRELGLLWSEAVFGAVERQRLMIAHVMYQVLDQVAVLVSDVVLVTSWTAYNTNNKQPASVRVQC
jgi:hypothetical protein